MQLQAEWLHEVVCCHARGLNMSGHE